MIRFIQNFRSTSVALVYPKFIWSSTCRPFHCLPIRAVPRSPHIRLASTLPTVAELVAVKRMSPATYCVGVNTDIASAAAALTARRVSSLLVTKADIYDDSDVSDGGTPGSNRVVGMITARDILRGLTAMGTASRPEELAVAGHATVGEIMTPASKILFVRPDDNVQLAASLMSTMKVRILPVLERDGTLLGTLTLKDIADSITPHVEGTKESFMETIQPRRGIEGSATITASATIARDVLALRTGAVAKPGPGKEYPEDAHFIAHLRWAHDDAQSVSYMGIADGVGSWLKYGVDPAAFPTRLMAACTHELATAASARGRPPIPVDLLERAWDTVLNEGTEGSSTAMVCQLDNEYNQLAYANVGDSGLLVLRKHLAHEQGTMHLSGMPGRSHDWSVVARSTQQLRGFNMPYQLGCAPGTDSKEARLNPNFETPADAEVSRFSVQPGDIVLCASDGLFDNVFETETLDIVAQWAQEHAGVIGKYADTPAAPGDEDAMHDLADRLVEYAYSMSLRRDRDSPFALLAKDNDILWSQGGRMDDITVVAARVTPAIELDYSDDEGRS